jgi:hypothetical protein
VKVTLSADGCDAEMRTSPVVFDVKEEGHMLHHGYGYGRTGIDNATVEGD